MESQAIPTAEVPSAPKTVPALKLKPSGLELAEFVQTVWVANPAAGVPYESLFSPSYWTHVADKLKPFAKIIVSPEEGGYYAELLVIYASRTEVVVRQILYVGMESSIDEVKNDTTGYEINFGGRMHLWRVIRKSDKEIVGKGFNKEFMAQEWLDNYLKQLQAH